MTIIILCREGDPVGSYGRAEAKNVWNAIKEWLEIKGSKIHTFPLSACNKWKRPLLPGKRVLVLGSQTPWMEALLLEAGAARITTVDYVQIHSLHPLIETMTPKQVSEKYLKGTLPQFDAMATFSSLEHSGLGR